MVAHKRHRAPSCYAVQVFRLNARILRLESESAIPFLPCEPALDTVRAGCSFVTRADALEWKRELHAHKGAVLEYECEFRV